MTKKILISLFFVIAFVLFLSFTNKVSALTFNYNNNDVVLPDYDSLLEKNKADCAVIFYHKVKNYYELYILRSHDSTDFYSIIPRYNAPTYTLSPYWEYHLNTSSNSWDFYHYSDNLYSGGISVGENSSYEIVYSNVDIKDKNGDIAFAGASSTDVPDKFFNFRHGTLDYSINLTANNNNIVLWNNIAVFQANNILLIYTSQERPTYKYSNYKHYLHTTGVTTIYGYDLKTDTVIADETITKFSKTGMDVAFDKSQLIYSNFVLFDEIMHPIFLTIGDYLGEEDMKGTASGNIAAGGPSSDGNSLLNDYINSQNPNYSGSSNQGSDTVSGGFNSVYGKFGFAEDVKKNVNGMVDVITNTSKAPKFQLNVNSKYYKGTLTIVDLSWYEPYKEMGDNVICIFAYLGFLWRIFIRLPDIIRGAGADSYAGDMGYEIGLWNKYGMGRSSSPRGITERKQGLSAHVFKRR